ncbi:MAG: hypothetical protein ABIN96_11870, partial [Rubrivivax sp.]
MSIRTLLLAWFMALAATCSWAAELSITGYTLVSSRRLSATDFEYVYTAQLSNSGPALNNVIGTVLSTNPATTIVQGALSFGNVTAGDSATSLNTATFRHNRSQPFDLNKLVWTLSGTPAAPIQSEFTFTPTSGNAPLTIRFTPTPITNAAINLYQWDLDGNGSFEISDTVGRDQTRNYTAP